jgi:hypothetical protein
MVRGRQPVDLTLQGGPKHTVGCPREDNHQVVPKNLQIGIESYSLWYMLSSIPREAPGLTMHHR